LRKKFKQNKQKQKFTLLNNPAKRDCRERHLIG
jgi:hypothetical protein